MPRYKHIRQFIRGELISNASSLKVLSLQTKLFIFINKCYFYITFNSGFSVNSSWHFSYRLGILEMNQHDLISFKIFEN